MHPSIKNTLDSSLKIAGFSIVVLFFVEVTLSIITIFQVNEKLGFCYATPETSEGELFKITKIVTGGTMDRAGLKPGDQIQMIDVNDLYKLLLNNQGKEVTIDVVRNSKINRIRIKVPELDVPLAEISFLF
jgi:C-terminal processing protease CtpA/Prc